MRYNPETDKARDIGQLAEQARQVITRPSVTWPFTPDDIDAAESCRTWNLCLAAALSQNDRVAIGKLESLLGDDMHRAMHHRPHQPEF
jgi:hypothetical protein